MPEEIDIFPESLPGEQCIGILEYFQMFLSEFEGGRVDDMIGELWLHIKNVGDDCDVIVGY